MGQSLRDQLREDFRKLGLLADPDDELGDYADAADLSVEEIRKALKDIPTGAVEAAFQREREPEDA